LEKTGVTFQEFKVEQDTIPAQFKKLEEKVGQLVQTCNDLQRGKAELEAKIRDYQRAFEVKGEAEQKYMEEKMMIRSRIDDLLGRLDQVLDST
jgi:exonuclease VII small subunit